MRTQGSELQGACRWIYVYIVATVRDIENDCICALCVHGASLISLMSSAYCHVIEALL